MADIAPLENAPTSPDMSKTPRGPADLIKLFTDADMSGKLKESWGRVRLGIENVESIISETQEMTVSLNITNGANELIAVAASWKDIAHKLVSADSRASQNVDELLTKWHTSTPQLINAYTATIDQVENALPVSPRINQLLGNLKQKFQQALNDLEEVVPKLLQAEKLNMPLALLSNLLSVTQMTGSRLTTTTWTSGEQMMQKLEAADSPVSFGTSVIIKVLDSIQDFGGNEQCELCHRNFRSAIMARGPNISANSFASLVFKYFESEDGDGGGLKGAHARAQNEYNRVYILDALLDRLPTAFTKEVGKVVCQVHGPELEKDLKNYFKDAKDLTIKLAKDLGLGPVQYLKIKYAQRLARKEYKSYPDNFSGPLHVNVNPGAESPKFLATSDFVIHICKSGLPGFIPDRITLETPLGRLPIWQGRLSDDKLVSLKDKFKFVKIDPDSKGPFADAKDSFYAVDTKQIIKHERPLTKVSDENQNLSPVSCALIWKAVK